MALYHCHIKLVQRSKGKSVVAAAYRSGEKLTNEWDGETHDYTKKGEHFRFSETADTGKTYYPIWKG